LPLSSLVTAVAEVVTHQRPGLQGGASLFGARGGHALVLSGPTKDSNSGSEFGAGAVLFDDGGTREELGLEFGAGAVPFNDGGHEFEAGAVLF
jgi:hypothetical protein